MTDDVDSTIPVTPPTPDGPRRPVWLLAALAAAVVLALILGGVLVFGGGTGKRSRATSSAAPGGAVPDGRVASDPGSSASNGAGSGSNVGTTSRNGTTNATSTPNATANPTAAPAAPALAKPAFTSASVDPDSFTCTPGENQYTYVRWTTTNATTVTMGDKNGLEPNSSSPYFYPFKCGEKDSVTLVAHGAGGDTTKTVNWRWQAPQP
jgi:hypothetical protein